MKLNSLLIKSFRGAVRPVTIDFSSEKNIALIFGENGEGKSTIADALVSLCTDGVGSLGDKSGTDLSFIKSLGADDSDLLIELKTDTGSFKATLSNTGRKLEKNPASNLPKIEALRRSQITSLIESSPSKRYEVLSSFIDVSNIQKGEAELKKLIASLSIDLDQNVKSKVDAEHTLNEIWEKEGKPSNNVETWAKAETLKDFEEIFKELKVNNSLLQKWQTLQVTISFIKTEKEKYDIAKSNLEVAENKLKEYKKNYPTSESDLLSLLKETRDYLTSKTSISKCPVCEKENNKDLLLSSVTGRIAQMQELNKLTSEIKALKEAEMSLHSRLLSQVEPFNTQIMSIKNDSIPLPGFKFKDIFTEVFDSGETSKYYKGFISIKEQLAEEFDKLNKHNETVNKSVSIHSSITSNYSSILSLTDKCKSLEKLLKKANDSLKTIEETRKTFVDNELNSISGEVEHMYQSIHPNEELGNVKLSLNHKYQNSLNLTAKFYSSDNIAPQNIYSESHLDTLGICIFIALAKKESNKDLILILDDIVMSVDESHLDRLIDLIHDESKHFAHILIFTHYRPWRERYRNNRIPSSNIQFIELRGWSKERGITLAKPKIILDEIKFYLIKPENFHRENLASTSGRFQESLLDFLTFNFQSKLRRKPGSDYTLSELLDSLSKDLLKELRVQKMKKLPDGTFSQSEIQEEIYLKPVIDEMKSLKFVRNQVGAHFNFDGSLVSDKDIEAFANATIMFTELLICPVNGNLPDRNRGTHWETKSGAIRLLPLVEPQK